MAKIQDGPDTIMRIERGDERFTKGTGELSRQRKQVGVENKKEVRLTIIGNK